MSDPFLPPGSYAAARAFFGRSHHHQRAALREHHSHGQDTQTPVMPDAVAFIETTEEASKLLALCHAERVPVVAWGAGTSLEGHVTPVRGGITLDLSRMTKVLDVSQADMDCRVEAGVTRDQLNTHLRDLGLFFPVDPGTSLCTIGGMCATLRLRHQCGPLWHDAGERDGADRRSGRRAWGSAPVGASENPPPVTT